VIDARKERFDDAGAWNLLKGATSVTIAKGKKFQKFENVAGQKEEIISQAMGPSGNLRAPTYRVGDEFVIGFNPELYADWVK
jgi:hypothetical protein